MNTTENNKLLAEFMGWDIQNLVTIPTNLHLSNLQVDNGELLELSFHTDWDSLMLVVEKIEDLGNDVLITTNYIQIAFDEGEQFIVVEDTKNKIESVYNACVAFVQWYNSSNRA